MPPRERDSVGGRAALVLHGPNRDTVDHEPVGVVLAFVDGVLGDPGEAGGEDDGPALLLERGDGLGGAGVAFDRDELLEVVEPARDLVVTAEEGSGTLLTYYYRSGMFIRDINLPDDSANWRGFGAGANWRLRTYRGSANVSGLATGLA